MSEEQRLIAERSEECKKVLESIGYYKHPETWKDCPEDDLAFFIQALTDSMEREKKAYTLLKNCSSVFQEMYDNVEWADESYFTDASYEGVMNEVNDYLSGNTPSGGEKEEG